jgi:hypothetical protein
VLVRLFLTGSALLVGTGNSTGDVYYTCDDGESWQRTGDVGNNIVVWGIAQAADGTVWLGSGSRGGDVLRATPPSGVVPDEFLACP